MRKLDLAKIAELTAEDLEQYASELETAVKNPEDLTAEDLERCAAELTAVIDGPFRDRFDGKITYRLKILRHTVQNERVLKNFVQQGNK